MIKDLGYYENKYKKDYDKLMNRKVSDEIFMEYNEHYTEQNGKVIELGKEVYSLPTMGCIFMEGYNFKAEGIKKFINDKNINLTDTDKKLLGLRLVEAYSAINKKEAYGLQLNTFELFILEKFNRRVNEFEKYAFQEEFIEEIKQLAKNINYDNIGSNKKARKYFIYSMIFTFISLIISLIISIIGIVIIN